LVQGILANLVNLGVRVNLVHRNILGVRRVQVDLALVVVRMEVHMVVVEVGMALGMALALVRVVPYNKLGYMLEHKMVHILLHRRIFFRLILLSCQHFSYLV